VRAERSGARLTGEGTEARRWLGSAGLVICGAHGCFALFPRSIYVSSLSVPGSEVHYRGRWRERFDDDRATDRTFMGRNPSRAPEIPVDRRYGRDPCAERQKERGSGGFEIHAHAAP